MTLQSVSASNAPAPVGPYSPAIVWERLVFISGQGPLSPETGRPVGGDISAQTRQVFANLDALLTAAGSSRQHVLKVQVYLADINDFAAMNKVYAEFFAGCTFPARTTIQAAGLPGGIGIEIDIVAFSSA